MKTVKISLVFAVLLSCSMISTTAFASVADDQVTSQKIKEADGTSGQNTNSGSGVKTGHIQDDAVTTSKIADSAVTGNKVADSAVSTGKIADGAVTDAKISGPISASKISSTGLNADTVDGLHGTDLAPAVHTHPQSQVTGLEAELAIKADVLHNHDGLYQQKYGKVAVVAQTGGDYTDPVAAMNDVVTWCGSPSATNPCLLKIMPGFYDIGSNTLAMQPYVDIKGLGRNVTTITGNTNSGYLGVIAGSSFVELSALTVSNTGGGDWSIAIGYLGYQSDGFRISDAKIVATGGLLTNRGVDWRGLGLTMENVDIIVTMPPGTGHGTGNNAVGINTHLGDPNALIKLHNININASSGGIVLHGFSFDLSQVNIVASGPGGGITIVSNSAAPIAKMQNVTANVATGAPAWSSGLTMHVGSKVQLFDCNFKGQMASLHNQGDVKAVSTQFNGPIAMYSPGTLKTVNCFEENFNPIPNQ